jgi:hypothetical protein
MCDPIKGHHFLLLQPCPLSRIHVVGQWGCHELGLLGEKGELQFLAPVLTVDLFKEELLVLYGDGSSS